MGKLERMYNNIRYKLVQVDDTYYILDMDRVIWSIIFPFMQWFRPQLVYQIDQAMYEKVTTPPTKKGVKVSIIFLYIGAPIALGRLLYPYIKELTISSSFVETITILVSSFALAFMFRLFYRYSEYKKLTKMIKLETLPKRYIHIKAKKLISYVPVIYFYCFLVGFSALFSYTYIVTKNIFLPLVLLLFSFLYFLFNTTFIPLGPVKVTYLKDNNRAS